MLNLERNREKFDRKMKGRITKCAHFKQSQNNFSNLSKSDSDKKYFKMFLPQVIN